LLSSKRGYGLIGILKLLLCVSLIQAAIGISAFFFPSFKAFLVEWLFTGYYDTKSALLVRTRLFGVSQSMLFGIGIFQAFMASLSFYFAIRFSFKYLLFVPVLFFSAIINVRTSLIVFTINALLTVITFLVHSRGKQLVKVITAVTIIVVFAFVLSSVFSASEDITISWVSRALEETTAFLRGTSTGTYAALETMFLFPDKYTAMFGSGTTPFGVKYEGHSSDIGYINDLHLGGIFYTITLYLSFFVLLLGSVRGSTVEARTTVLLMVTTMLLVNVKGPAFRVNEFTNAFFFISLFMNYTFWVRSRSASKHIV